MSLRRRLSLAARSLGLRPEPLNWQGVETGADDLDNPGTVEIIVPVHGAHDVTRDCLASVARHTDLTHHRLTVVVDGDPAFGDREIREALTPMVPETLKILRNECTRGFVASVNRAMAESPHDVLLLNSDVVVTAGWLDKMTAAAASVPGRKVATVTPFSNDATLCSIPEPLRHNEVPAGHDIDSFARLVEASSSRSRPRLPTGVGMCLLIRRAALDELGLFDEAAFGTGYGEETDFCLRALKAGWIHLLDDATFVFHHGRQSFGAARDEHVRRAETTLTCRHRAYTATLDAFLRQDLLGHGPAAVALRRVRWALRQAPGARFRSARPRRVLHLVHGWPPHDHGGTEQYARWLVESQLGHREVAVYARIADPRRAFGDATETVNQEGLRLRLVVNNFTQRNPLARNALYSRKLGRDFGRFLDEVAPDLVHVHHMAGHAISLLDEIRRRNLPMVYQVQDWWAFCARANLLRRPGREPCDGPTLGRCSACLPLTGLLGAPVWNRLLYALRHRLARRALGFADAYVMGSHAIRDDYEERGLLPAEGAVYVLPYGVDVPTKQQTRAATGLPLRLGAVGAVLPHKGLHVAAEALTNLPAGSATLDVWGNADADPTYARELTALAPEGTVHLHGRFDDDDKAAIFESMDVLLMPSLGKESFGLVAREALSHGVPVIASRHGALAELFEGTEPAGALLPPGDIVAWRAELQRLVEDPAVVDRWRRRIRPVTGLGEHAEAIEQVYADVLSDAGTLSAT